MCVDSGFGCAGAVHGGGCANSVVVVVLVSWYGGLYLKVEELMNGKIM